MGETESSLICGHAVRTAPAASGTSRLRPYGQGHKEDTVMLITIVAVGWTLVFMVLAWRRAMEGALEGERNIFFPKGL